MDKNIKIDDKDREILYELDQDCRQSLKQIAKKVKSKKTVVAYRIKRLENEGVISGYYTLVNPFLLGYDSYRVYFNFYNLTSDTEKEILDYLIKDEMVYFVSSLEGRFDLVACRWIKNKEDFYSFFENLMKRYRPYIQNYFVTPYKATLFSAKYLGKITPTARKEWKLDETVEKKVDFDDIDYKILKEIAYNAKAPIVEISEKLKLIPNTIKNRIKKLKETGVIKAFRADIDFESLGYTWFKVDIELSKYVEYETIIKMIKENPNTSVIDTSVGLADIEFEIHYRNINELKKFLDKLKNKFESIKKFYYFTESKIHKIDFMPKL